MVIISKRPSYSWYIYSLLIYTRKKRLVCIITRMIVAEVVPNAWSLATFVPTTFDLSRYIYDIYNICAYQTNH